MQLRCHISSNSQYHINGLSLLDKRQKSTSGKDTRKKANGMIKKQGGRLVVSLLILGPIHRTSRATRAVLLDTVNLGKQSPTLTIVGHQKEEEE